MFVLLLTGEFDVVFRSDSATGTEALLLEIGEVLEDRRSGVVELSDFSALRDDLVDLCLVLSFGRGELVSRSFSWSRVLEGMVERGILIG